MTKIPWRKNESAQESKPSIRALSFLIWLSESNHFFKVDSKRCRAFLVYQLDYLEMMDANTLGLILAAILIGRDLGKRDKPKELNDLIRSRGITTDKALSYWVGYYHISQEETDKNILELIEDILYYPDCYVDFYLEEIRRRSGRK